MESQPGTINSHTTVQVIGCGDAFSNGGRFHTCFFVKSPSANFLVDCGATSMVALKKAGISTNEIDMIVISHFHGDHFGGLPFFFLDAHYHEKRIKALTIVTPKGGYDRIKNLTSVLYPGSPEIMAGLDLIFVEYEALNTIDINGVSLITYPAIHTPESNPHSLRFILDNKIISYSGDTEWNEYLIPLADMADLFICESCNYKNNVKGHLSFTTLLSKKKYLNASKFLLTHMGDEALMHTSIMEKDVDCAEDGLIITI